ncbi:hypothetical protein JTE90_018853 [Oedothorax gibbosus]|uniref:Reverse transcriptase domain-containing protein n=1 Tax=Oedothorax gibbosus TaxID=931172 RepID=A0AAV6TU58_9ARAC|nr:hypothetical protein JTE90_018853 [Oedothorax gibbosus]
MDLENAFGAFSHDLIFEGLKRAGLPNMCIGLIRSLYTNARCNIRTTAGLTEAIPMQAGILASREFNSVAGKLRFSLMLMTSCWWPPDAATLQKGLTRLEGAATLASLRFKPRKCATLYISQRPPAVLAFYIYGQSLPLLSNDAAYKYLGVKVGLSAKQDYTANIRGEECNP